MDPVVLRPRGAQVLGVVMVAIAAVTGVLTVFDGLTAVLDFGAPTALFGVLGWAAFWVPRVEVSDGGVTVVNTLRTLEVPWPAVHEVHGRYGLRLDTAYGVVRAWGAAAPAGRQRARREESASATLVNQRLSALRREGHLDQPRLERADLEVRWHTGVLATVTVLVILSVLLPVLA